MSKHTELPWVVESNPSIPEGKQVAAFETSGEAAGNRHLQVIIRSHNLDADAHLIAAAPELYEALQDALEKYGYQEMDAQDYARYGKALAKARGELEPKS